MAIGGFDWYDYVAPDIIHDVRTAGRRRRYWTSLDLEGAGVLHFTRSNHWHGSPWHYTVDGTDYIVEETSTPDPTHPSANATFLPERLFPNPLALTWSQTKGSDLTWEPISFERSFRMAYERTHYGTGYYIYDNYVGGAPLSRPIRSWNPDSVPPEDVLDLISRSGSDLVGRARGADAAGIEH